MSGGTPSRQYTPESHQFKRKQGLFLFSGKPWWTCEKKVRTSKAEAWQRILRGPQMFAVAFFFFCAFATARSLHEM
jgi:hypothetical protein